MTYRRRNLRFTGTALSLSACAMLAGCGGGNEPAAAAIRNSAGASLADGNAASGRTLFVEKGCVLCHSVNGVGGRAATALDALPDEQVDEKVDGQVDAVAFAARMWRGAPAMIELQSLELGYVVEVSADEIRDLAAFAASADEQSRLTKDDLPESLADAVLNDDFWEAEDWREFLRSGQEAYDPNE